MQTHEIISWLCRVRLIFIRFELYTLFPSRNWFYMLLLSCFRYFDLFAISAAGPWIMVAESIRIQNKLAYIMTAIRIIWKSYFCVPFWLSFGSQKRRGDLLYFENVRYSQHCNQKRRKWAIPAILCFHLNDSSGGIKSFALPWKPASMSSKMFYNLYMYVLHSVVYRVNICFYNNAWWIK